MVSRRRSCTVVCRELAGVAGPAPHDIDLMSIGSPSPEAVYDACERVERLVGRPVNPTIMTSEVFRHGGGFVDHLQAGPRTPVIALLP